MLDYEIRELIQKSLPEQVGNVLRTRLDKADKDTAAVERLTKELMDLDEKLRNAQSFLKNHDAIDKRLIEVEKREAAVVIREAAANLNDFKVKAAESAKQDIYTLASIVFKNPTYTRYESQSRHVCVPGLSYPQQVSESASVTETIE